MENDKRELTPEQKERYEKFQKEFREGPFFKTIQKIAKEHAERMAKLQKDLAPTLEQISRMQKMLSSQFTQENTISIPRPVEYQILDELRELNRKRDLAAENPNTIVIDYNEEDNTLERNIDGRTFSYDLSENGKRKKALDTLLKQRGYVKTSVLMEKLSCPSNPAVSKLIQTFNDYARVSLRLAKIKLIEGKKGSGYRINKNITIQRY